ncbi:MAG: hypothetical protein IT355_06385 [Gemmatimonadaceae bacterium]|nr:hypothetical protein [Gemmatimonadaceae bacterium]
MPDDRSEVTVAAPSSVQPLLDRAAMERVLARAAELANQGSDAPDGMSEAQLLEIAKEVGLSASTIKQALAEERTRVMLAEETGFEARVMGPAAVSATRAVPHAPEVVLAALDEWLRAEYRLIPKRRYDNRRTWEKRHGMFAELDRNLRGNQAAASLMRATEVAATVSPIGDGRTAVRLDADISHVRSQHKAGGIGLAIGGIAIGTVPVIIGAVLAPLTMLPLFIALGTLPGVGMGIGGWTMLKAHRKQAERAQLALEQILDRLEHGALPRGALAGGATPLLSETITAVAQGVRDVAKAMQDSRRLR